MIFNNNELILLQINVFNDNKKKIILLYKYINYFISYGYNLLKIIIKLEKFLN